MPATLSYTGKLVSVIKSKLSWLDMHLCASLIAMMTFLLQFVLIYEYLPVLHIILNNTLITPNGIICSTPGGVLEVHEMFYYSGRV